MNDTLEVGLEHTMTFKVPEEKTVPYLYPEARPFREMPKVFATGFMVGFVEWACMEALAPHLEEGERTVGTKINITHSAATPPGMEVTAKVRCVRVDGKRTLWEIEVRDEIEEIGRGTHERYTINMEKFTTRMTAKGRR